MQSNFDEVLDYLYTRLPVFQRQGGKAFKPGLDRTFRLLDWLNNPQDKLKFIHIAGTNGKGTSAHAIAAVLQVSGHNVGLYTSPHLKSFTERIRVNGRNVTEDWVVDAVQQLKPAIEEIEPSFFEVTVGLAMQYFYEMRVDICVIETGMGGRLDSTNVIIPEVSLITNIGMDHTEYLGDTIPAIAREKAGIIKENVPVVIGADMVGDAVTVMYETSRQRCADIFHAKQTDYAGFDLSACPPYFQRNLPAILQTLSILQQQGWKLDHQHLIEGIENFIQITGMKGRFQLLSDSPKTIADVSHNAEGLQLLFDHIHQLPFDQLHVIYGTVNDKSLAPVFEVMPKNARYYFTQSHVPRALATEDLQRAAKQSGYTGDSFDNVNDAMAAATKNAGVRDVILVTGSTFVIAEIKNL